MFNMKCLLWHIIANTGRTQKISADRSLNCLIGRHDFTVSDHKLLERLLHRWYGKKAWIEAELVHKQKILECMFVYLAQWDTESDWDTGCFKKGNADFQLRMALGDVRVWKYSNETHMYTHRGFGLLWHILGNILLHLSLKLKFWAITLLIASIKDRQKTNTGSSYQRGKLYIYS